MFTLDLSYVRELKNYLTCPKCDKLTENPQKLYNCRHIVCQQCLKSSGFKCPKCDAMFTDRDIKQPDIYIKHMLNLVNKIDANFAGTDYLIRDIPLDFFKREAVNDGKVQVNSVQASWSQTGWYVCPELGPNPIRRIAHVMKRNPKGESPLHIACKRGMLSEALMWIEKGVDINATDWANWTPLHEAVQSNVAPCVELLLSKGALVDVNGEDYRTPLYQAVTLANKDIVKLLLQYGADKNVLDYSGQTPKDIQTTSSISDILEKTEPNDVLPERSLYYQSSTVIFILDVDKLTMKKLSSHKYVITKDSHAKDIFLCALGKSVLLSHPDVLKFIAKGVMIIRENDLGNYLSRGLPYAPELIPEDIRAGLLKSIRYHLEKKPSLFDCMNFHIFGHHKPVAIEGSQFSKDDLHALITAAGGTVLTRAPAVRTVSSEPCHPYHCQKCDILKMCCNFIVYPEKEAPLLLYNMAELRHVSSRWLVKCLMNYEISY